jgi:5-formyltetrahydrofolate cyclo-ligase
MNKKELRIQYKSIRNSVINKSDSDRKISEYFINSPFFHNSDIYLCYVSVGSEVDTSYIIDKLLSNGKKVAVPNCKNGIMDYYEIKSADELIEGAYGIPTADIKKSIRITSFDNALCIVPALSFDKSGFRLGYGGGYYDRFLIDKSVFTLGLCYEDCICESLPVEEHDIKINSLLTEKGFRNLKEDTYERKQKR